MITTYKIYFEKFEIIKFKFINPLKQFKKFLNVNFVYF